MSHIEMPIAVPARLDAMRSNLHWLALCAAALALALSGAAHAQSYMNVTIGGAFAPGVYGQIAVGNSPPPPVLNLRPIVIGRPIHGAPVLYLHVSPEEHRHWKRHCARYNACGHPVNFVKIDNRNRWWEHHDGERHDNRRAGRDENRR